jgi:predicted Zn-dependent protease
MRSHWQAFYLDGRTAIRHAVTVRLMREGLEVAAGNNSTRLWPYRELRQTQGFHSGEEVRFERGGEQPEVLVVPDVDFLASLHEAAPHVGRRFHDPARRAHRLRLTVLAAVGAIAVTAGIYLWGIPALAAVVATVVPVSWEERVGQSAVAYLAPPAQRCNDPQLQAAVNEVVEVLTAAGPRSPYALRVYVVHSPVVNALAIPGGYIVVFQGLLERTRSPEELAGVLAHELQHVLRRHVTRAIIQDASTGLLVATLTADGTGPLVYGLQTARAFGNLRYSRRAEEEADLEGMKMLLAAGVDPAGMIDFFGVLEKQEGARTAAFKYLSTHPIASDRIERLKSSASARPGAPIKLLPGTDWARLAKRC